MSATPPGGGPTFASTPFCRSSPRPVSSLRPRIGYAPPMRTLLLGQSGLRVSELCLGTMTFGLEWGFGADEDECARMFHAYVERGGNFIDTANKYTNGESERIVGRLIASRRDRYVVATKYSLSMDETDPNAHGNHRKNLVQSVEASLRRLDTDRVDLLWLHAWDGTTSVQEVMRALDDLVRAGKVLYLGISDAPAWVVSRANTLAELRGWTPFVGLQIEYSLIERTVERELVPMAEAMGLGICAWAPLGGGVLTGKYTQGAAADTKRAAMNEHRVNERNLAIATALQSVADELGCTPAQAALLWLRARRAQVVPVIGSRKASQIQANLEALDHRLEPAQLERLDAVSAVDLGFPRAFLARMSSVLYGGFPDLADARRGG